MTLLVAVAALAIIVFLGLLAAKVAIVLCLVAAVLILLFGAGFGGFVTGRRRR